MSRMRLIYVAGRYRSSDPWVCEQNIRRAEDLAYEVAALGAYPVCPHSNTRAYFGSANTDAFWLAGTLELMRRCDAVIFVEGWQQSRGSVAEREEAHARKIPVFDSLDDLRAWLEVRS